MSSHIMYKIYSILILFSFIACNSAQNPSSSSEASDNENITVTVNGVTFTMVFVKGGTFTIGATPEQGKDAQREENPPVEVTLSDYYIGETEVTQALWQAVMGENPSYAQDDSKLPVELMYWDECRQFITKLNELTDRDFRLPAEAEWEYAARGGCKSSGCKYPGANEIDSVAWYEGNSGYRSHPVAQKLPNELGLYDMAGNVGEWCSDWYDDMAYRKIASKKTNDEVSGVARVVRGGNWESYASYCRVSSRSKCSPDYRQNTVGLRLALTPPVEEVTR